MVSAHAAWPSVIAAMSTVQTITARCQFPISDPSLCGIGPRHLSPATGSGASSVSSSVTCLLFNCCTFPSSLSCPLCRGSVILAKHMTAEYLPEEADHGSLQVIYGQRWREPYRGDQGRGTTEYQGYRHNEF